MNYYPGVHAPEIEQEFDETYWSFITLRGKINIHNFLCLYNYSP